MAYEMPNIDGLMSGAGRVRKSGYEILWGVGRHGPGANVFSYFVAPFGACIEYTAEVQRVTDDYKVGAPEDWKWPPGRGDHWGIASRDNDRLIASSKAFPYLRLAA